MIGFLRIFVFVEFFIFTHGGDLDWRTGLSDIILKVTNQGPWLPSLDQIDLVVSEEKSLQMDRRTTDDRRPVEAIKCSHDPRGKVSWKTLLIILELTKCIIMTLKMNVMTESVINVIIGFQQP